MTDFFKFRSNLEEAAKVKQAKKPSEVYEDEDGPCWKGYVQVGTKMKDGKEVPNCVPEETQKEQVSEARRAKTKGGDELKKGDRIVYGSDYGHSKDNAPYSVVDVKKMRTNGPGEYYNVKLKGPDNKTITTVFGDDDRIEMDESTSYESDLDPNKKIVVKGTKGMNSKKFTKTFRNMKAADKWMDDNEDDIEIMQVMNESTLSESAYYDYPDYGPVGASEMAQTQLHFIKYAADDVTRCLKSGCPMPEWYQNKLAKIEGDMEGLYSYMKGKTRKMKAHQADRYSMGMSMYGEETKVELNESYMDKFHFITKKERGKTVYLQYSGSLRVGETGPKWIEDPESANAYLDKKEAEKLAKRYGGKVQKGLNEQAQSGDDEAYEKFFNQALKRFGADSPADLSKEKKKEFFDYVDKNWKSDKELKNESYISEKLKPSDDVSKWIEDFYDSDAPQFKGKDKEERREMAVAAWLEARREAGYDVDPNPNE